MDAAQEQINVLRLARKIVVQQKLRLSHQDALLIFVFVFGRERRTDNLFRRDAVNLLWVGSDEVLPAAGHNIGFVAVVVQIARDLQHRLVHLCE